MDDRTYIKLFHKMLTWEWYGDTNTVRVFLHILLRANYKPSEYKGKVIGRGECAFGYRSWAKQLGMSVQEIRTAISHLQSTHEITLRATHQGSVIHVEKWDFWQLEEGQSNTPSNTRSNCKSTQSKDNKISSSTTTNKGKPNSVEEVRAYVAEKKLAVDADYFFDYYEENDWKDAKGNPVKSWKLKAQTWSKREQKNGNNNADSIASNSRNASEKTAGDSGNGSDRENSSQSWFIPEMEITI